jgi:acyl carrier protein
MRGEKLRQHLLARCHEHGVFLPDERPGPDEDLIEAGLIDSLGLLTLEHIAEEAYGVVIPPVVFVSQLRTLNQMTTHLESAMPAERRAALLGGDDGD